MFRLRLHSSDTDDAYSIPRALTVKFSPAISHSKDSWVNKVFVNSVRWPTSATWKDAVKSNVAPTSPTSLTGGMAILPSGCKCWSATVSLDGDRVGLTAPFHEIVNPSPKSIDASTTGRAMVNYVRVVQMPTYRDPHW